MSATTQCINLLHITDTHIRATPDTTLLGVNTAHYFQKVVQFAVAHYAFDSILITGDLTQDPCVASYQYIRDVLSQYNIPCICLPGNHDDNNMMQWVFNTDNIHCRKQVLVGEWQIISLNSQIIGENGGYLADEELAFLTQCLVNKPRHYAVIAMHHHCLPTQSSWMDTMLIKNSEALFSIIAEYSQVRAIVHGHVHQQLHTTVMSTQVLATPSTCFQFKPGSEEFALDDSSPGFRIIQLHANGRLHSEVIRLPEPLLGLQTDMHGY
jgi:3',5'-cyclic-AMP phosphodiesterase